MTLGNLLARISQKEWWLVAGLICITILITATPYIYGAITAPADTVYTGLHYLTPGDTNVWLSMIEQTRQGENVFINLYTGEPQHRIYINPLWLSVGWLTKLLPISNLLALHIARSLWIVVFVFVAYLFISYFFKRYQQRLITLLLLLFASGWGVFLNPFLFDVNKIYEHPVDMWAPESITFLTLYHTPHLIASLTLIICIFLLMLLAFENDKIGYSVGAGVISFFVLWFHPFNGPTIYAVMGIYLLVLMIKRRRMLWHHLKHYALLCLIPLPAVLYFFLISRVDWVIRQWSAQNYLPSPSGLMYIYGFGFLLALALWGVSRVARRWDERRIFLVVWFITAAILIYIPVNFQRRMVEGLHVPLVFLAAVAVFYIYAKLRRHSFTLAIFFGLGLVIFLPLSNFQILGQDIYLFTTKKTLPYYLLIDEVAGMRWLKDNVRPGQIIFSSYYIGNYIPAYSGRIVWIGHGPQTINLLEKNRIMEWFWKSDDEAEAKGTFLYDEHISYVWYGRKEKEIGDYNPDTKSYLEPVFVNSAVIIYLVTEQAGCVGR